MKGKTSKKSFEMREQPIGKMKKIIYNLSIIHRDIEKIML